MNSSTRRGTCFGGGESKHNAIDSLLMFNGVSRSGETEQAAMERKNRRGSKT